MKKKDDETAIKVEERHKEIDLIQSCISRMGQNSLYIKGWFLSLFSVMLTITIQKESACILYVGLMIVTLIFWRLDAFYLMAEKTIEIFTIGC